MSVTFAYQERARLNILTVENWETPIKHPIIYRPYNLVNRNSFLLIISKRNVFLTVHHELTIH